MCPVMVWLMQPIKNKWAIGGIRIALLKLHRMQMLGFLTTTTQTTTKSLTPRICRCLGIAGIMARSRENHIKVGISGQTQNSSPKRCAIGVLNASYEVGSIF
jgi:hypothetical protein